MEGRRCGSCGVASPPSASYCADCGASLEATYIALGRDSEATSEELESQPRFAGLLVPLAALAVLAIAGFVLFGGNGGDGDGVAIDDLPTPSAAPAASSTAAPEPTPTAEATPEPSPTPVRRVDPATLPDLDATHLVVAYGNEVSFLEVATGEWTTVDAGRRLGLWAHGPSGTQGPLHPFGAGILVQGETGGAMVVRADGEVENIGNAHSAWLMAVHDDRAFFQIDPGAGGARVEVVDPTGTVVQSIEIPTMSWPQSISADGRVMVQTGGRVFAVSGARAEAVAAGDLMGTMGDFVLVRQCDPTTACATDAINLLTGERFETPIPGGYVEPISTTGLVVHTDQTGGPLAFELVGNEFVEVELDRLVEAVRPVANDASGRRARVQGDVIEFFQLQPNDAALARVPWPAPTRCCSGELGIIFLTLE